MNGKPEFFKHHDVTIITWFLWSSCAQTQIQDDQLLSRFQFFWRRLDEIVASEWKLRAMRNKLTQVILQWLTAWYQKHVLVPLKTLQELAYCTGTHQISHLENHHDCLSLSMVVWLVFKSTYFYRFVVFN